jgi:hypothetical protein
MTMIMITTTTRKSYNSERKFRNYAMSGCQSNELMNLAWTQLCSRTRISVQYFTSNKKWISVESAYTKGFMHCSFILPLNSAVRIWANCIRMCVSPVSFKHTRQQNDTVACFERCFSDAIIHLDIRSFLEINMNISDMIWIYALKCAFARCTWWNGVCASQDCYERLHWYRRHHCFLSIVLTPLM